MVHYKINRNKLLNRLARQERGAFLKVVRILLKCTSRRRQGGLIIIIKVDIMVANRNKRVFHHECKQRLDGDWVIFYCTTCKNYEKRLNQKTGEVVTRHADSKHRAR